MNIPLHLKHSLHLRLDAALGRVEKIGRALAQRIDWQDWRADRPTVLCLRRSTFIKDVNQMHRLGHFNWALVSAAKIKRIQEYWVAPQLRTQTYFYNILQTKLAQDRKYLEQFAVAFLKAAQKIHPIDAILAGNTDYWQDEAIKIACKKLGIPFLVLGRENYTMKVDAINVFHRFRDSRFQFNGSGVAVYSDVTRRTMAESGSFPEGSVSVTGAPRLDHWIGFKSLPAPQRDTIVLINYSYPEGYLAPKNFVETAKLFAAAAKQSGNDTIFALKSKKQNEEDDARQLVPELNEAPIQYLCAEPLHEIYRRCRAVVGVNSLAVAEGFLAEMAVIVPNWGDARRKPEECLILRDDPEDIAVTYFADSPDQLAEFLRLASIHKLPPKGDAMMRRKRFCRHIELPDKGTCSDQVQAFIRHHMDIAGTGFLRMAKAHTASEGRL